LPFSEEYRRNMGFPKEGDVVDGFRVELVSVHHSYVKGSKPRRYEYPTEMIVNGKGSREDVKAVFTQFFSQRNVRLTSSYGNPYSCNPGEIEISELDGGSYSVKALGSCVRVHVHARKIEGENRGLEAEVSETALKVYNALFQNEGSVKVAGVIYPFSQTSRSKIKFVKIEGYTYIEQNPKKTSAWGMKAREGHSIMWVCKGSRYIAQVMDGEFNVLGRQKKKT